MANLTVIGCVSVDNIRVPGHAVRDVFGGSAGYAAMAASFFTDVALVSTIGTNYPQEILNTLRAKGIDIDGLRVLRGKSTHFDVEYDEELFEATYHAVDLNVLDEGILLPKDARRSKFIYISANDPDIQLALIDQLASSQVVATDTHSMWIETKREMVKQVMERIDIMFANNVEVCKFSERQSLKHAAKKIMALGVKHLIVKKGQHGAILFSDGKMYPAIAYDTYDMNIVDPTGCGDTVAGGYMGVLAGNRQHFEELNDIHLKALIFGLVVASFNIMDFSIGKLLSIAPDEIWRRYDRFRDMIRL